MVASILDASALIHALPNVLPSAKKSLQSPHDAIAALVHTVFTILAFRLVGIDESGLVHTFEGNVLPDEWNQHGPGNYTFRYRHEQSSLEFLVKVAKLGSRTLVNSIAIESDKAATLDISTNDFTSPSFFPHDLDTSSSTPLVHGFISSNRVEDFVAQLKLTTVQKLMPGLRKDGYSEQTDTNVGTSQPRAPNANPPPARPHPEQPPYPPRGDMPFAPPRNPLEIGRRDRDPFPANPFAPSPLFPDSSGDGMFVGPNHPIFGPGMAGRGPGGMGPWGGDGFLPPMGAPPGARFDPVGPGFGPPGGFPRGPGGRGRGPFGGDPDNDEHPPPGYGDMFM
ncbi:PI31 proteasome regulator N-terminal-domain-containing protein [Epithele typhae]|uniref:PI31 proteasome regulator N-terminal-domain-containing protein n=1 Tax=Epithele typhae TaxID=378194 RepID=UPI0020089CF7|nr:PI31 proteasome regulator N-terminal-domain-containing protein [Epithele typhae]KAH9943323.1 PI31 proteasome regulator N-terminal-domain-containing protein [Epithele typhae]